MTTKTYSQKASAIRAAKQAGLSEGQFEVVPVRHKGKESWKFVPAGELRAVEAAAVEPSSVVAASGAVTVESTSPAEDEIAPRTFVVEDYMDQPAVERTAVPSEPPAEAEAAPIVATTPVAGRPRASTLASPTKAVWAIADEMRAANPAAARKAIVDECVRRGVAFFTARTQYQKWSKARQANPCP